MYLWIQPNWRRVARKRACGIVIVCMAMRPPGASSRSQVAKNVGQYASPTASNISTDTIFGYVPSSSR